MSTTFTRDDALAALREWAATPTTDLPREDEVFEHDFARGPLVYRFGAEVYAAWAMEPRTDRDGEPDGAEPLEAELADLGLPADELADLRAGLAAGR